MGEMTLRAIWLCFGLVACGDKNDDNDGAGDVGDDTAAEGPELEGDDAGECSDGADNDLDTLFDCADPDCAGSPDCQDTGAVDYEPTQPVVSITPEAPSEQDDLTCTIVTDSVDPEGDTVTYTYAWTVDDAATGLSSADVQARFTAGDETWACTVTPSDGVNQGLSAQADVWVERLNTAPTAPVVAIEPDDPTADDDLICTIAAESSDAEDDPITYSYAWFLDGAEAGYTLTTVRASVTEEGEEWTCSVTPNDGREDGEPGSDSVVIPTCVGNGMEFNGTDSYVSVDASDDFSWSAEFAIEAWVWWGGETATDSQIIVDHGVSPDYSITLALAGQTTSSHGVCGSVDAGHVLFMVAGSSGTAKTCLESADSVLLEGWSHVAATYDNGTTYIFIDGVKSVQGRAGASASDATDQDLHVGGRLGGDAPFLGVIDELMLSTITRYSSDFTPVYEDTAADSDTAFLFTFDAGSGSTVADDSGNGHDGTIVNASWTSDSSCDAGGSR